MFRAAGRLLRNFARLLLEIARLLRPRAIRTRIVAAARTWRRRAARRGRVVPRCGLAREGQASSLGPPIHFPAYATCGAELPKDAELLLGPLAKPQALTGPASPLVKRAAQVPSRIPSRARPRLAREAPGRHKRPRVVRKGTRLGTKSVLMLGMLPRRAGSSGPRREIGISAKGHGTTAQLSFAKPHRTPRLSHTTQMLTILPRSAPCRFGHQRRALPRNNISRAHWKRRRIMTISVANVGDVVLVANNLQPPSPIFKIKPATPPATSLQRTQKGSRRPRLNTTLTKVAFPMRSNLGARDRPVYLRGHGYL